MSSLKYGALYLCALLTSSIVGYRYKKLRFHARVTTYILGLILCASIGVTSSLFFFLIGKSGISQWFVARVFYKMASPLTGIKFEIVQGQEFLKYDRPVVFISNHQSEFDILMLAKMFTPYCSITSKKSLRYIPFLGWFMTLSGAVFIDRGNSNKAIKNIDSAADIMKTRKQSIWVFPEGTRSYLTTPGLLKFKKGAFHIAIQAQVPIIPVVVQNYSHLMNFQNKRFESGVISVKVLEPISTTGLSEIDVDNLLEKSFNVMSISLMSMLPSAKNDRD